MQDVNESTPLTFSSEGLQTIPLRLGSLRTNKSIVHGGLLIIVALLMLVEPQQLMTFFVTEIASRYLIILGGSIALTVVAFIERWQWLIFVGMTLFSVAVASQYVVVTSGAALTIALAESCFLFFLLMRVWFHRHLHWALVFASVSAVCSALIFAMQFGYLPQVFVLPILLLLIAVMFIIDLRRS
jgi:hypothetical protein